MSTSNNNPNSFTGASLYHKNGIKGNDIVVAIVDTGVEPHPDLAFYGEGWGAKGINPYKDVNGHGTHVAGIAAGKKYGVAPGAKILSVRITEGHQALLTDMEEGLNWLVNWKKTHKERLVVNISFSGTTSKNVLDAINTLVAMDVPVCVASGNDSKDISPLGYYTSPIVVGNMHTTTSMHSTSNCYGDETDCVMIGTDVRSCDTNGRYTIKTGTSMASPAVAGMMALILERWKSISEPAAVAQLLRTGRDELLKCHRGNHYIPYVNFEHIEFGETSPVTSKSFDQMITYNIPSGKSLVVRDSAGGKKIDMIKNDRKVLYLGSDGAYYNIAYPVSSKETSKGWVSSKYLK